MKMRRFWMILSLVFTLAINILANALPINNLTTGEISDRFPILFVPEGYVFSIWGLIYLFLIAFMVYSLTPKGLADLRIDAASWWFVAANLFNASWILLWHNLQFPLTLISMMGLLLSLIAIYLMLGVGRLERTLFEKILVEVPFSIYLGWITVATVANVSQVLYVTGWRGEPLSEAAWAVIMIVIASVLGLLMVFFRGEVTYPLVLAWAFIGIWVKQSDTTLVATTALVAGLIQLGLVVGRWTYVKVKQP